MWMRCSQVVDEMWVAEWLERMTVHAEVAIVLGSIPAFSDTVR
jgi:hypothetical protein